MAKKIIIPFFIYIFFIFGGLMLYARADIRDINIPSNLPTNVKEQVERLKSTGSKQKIEAIQKLARMDFDKVLIFPILKELLNDADTEVGKNVMIFAETAAYEINVNDPNVIELLDAAIRHADQGVRIKALEASTSYLLMGLKNPTLTRQLIIDLQDSDVKIRREAALALGKTKDQLAVGPFIKALNDADKEVRYLAIGALRDINDPRALDSIIAKANDADVDIRLVALSALGQFKDQRATECIFAALKDKNLRIRRSGAIILGSIKDPRGVDLLSEMLLDKEIKNTEIQQQVIYALQKINDPRVVGALIAVLNDTTIDEGIRNTIIRALGELQDPRAVGPLINELKILNSKEENKYFNIKVAKDNIASFLEEITHYNFGTDVKKWQEWYAQFQADNQPLKAVEIAARKEKLKAFGANKDKSAIPLIIESLKDKNPDVRTSASWALANIADKTTVPALIEALKDEDYRVRGNAIWGLGEIKDDSVILPLVEALKDSNNEVRQNAIVTLTGFGNIALPSLLKKLEEERLNEQDETTRARVICGIVNVLGNMGGKSVVPYFFNLLKDKDPNVIIYATEALCMMKDEKIINDLMKFVMQEMGPITESPPEIKDSMGPMEYLQAALPPMTVISIQMGILNSDESMIPILIKFLGNKDWKIRSFVIKLLSELTTNYPAYTQAVISSLKNRLNDENPTVAGMAKKYLERLSKK